MLRIGEITAGTHPVRVKDVKLGENKHKILFIFRTSKTHWLDSRPQRVKITSQPMMENDRDLHSIDCESGMQFSPYDLLHRYIHTRETFLSKEEPFFVFRDLSPVQPAHM